MFDHISIGVRDLAAARRFYDALFAPLGHALAWSNEKEAAYGREGRERSFWLYPVAEGRVAGQGAHVAFAAEDEAAVQAVFAAATRAGAQVIRAAGAHPDIAPDYYGTVLVDPDGNKLEVLTTTMH